MTSNNLPDFPFINGTEPPAQPNGTVKHKRNRTAQSCVQCRQRKVRCDRGYPCAPCLRSKNSLECSYDRRNTPKGNASSENFSILQQKTGRPPRQETTPLSSSSNNRTTEDAAVFTVQPGAAAHSQRLIENLQEQVQQLREAVSSNLFAIKSMVFVNWLWFYFTKFPLFLKYVKHVIQQTCSWVSKNCKG